MRAFPSLRQLAYLVELAERLNFHAAAEAQFVTQSTLSAGIKELEILLGAQLVERDKRTVRLTAAGQQVAERARDLLAQASDLAEAARSAGAPLSGALRFGAIPTIAPFVLPDVLPLLRQKHQALKLYLREDFTHGLLERVRSGDLDIALIALPYDTGELYVRELFRDEFWFVARNDFPMRDERMNVRNIDTAEVLLLEEGHCLREHAIAACGPRRGAWKAKIEATSLYTLMQMVEGGLGTTLLPHSALNAGLLKGTRLIARPFIPPAPARTLALVSRRTSPRRAEVDMLAELMTRRRADKARSIRPPRQSPQKRARGPG
jgi:LysR family transcriptional regulator, hydrogen peroxide-inducible genes activator